MSQAADDSGWAEFYAAQRGRPARKPFELALAAVEQRLGKPGRAADIGCGDGVETCLLLARGWQVMALDSEPASAAFVRAEVQTKLKAADAARLQTQTAAFVAMALPEGDLFWAGTALPFCAPADFSDVWARISAALPRGGCFAGHFFGPNDSWAVADDADAGEPGLSFHDAAAVRALLAGFDTVEFNEREWDGGSGGGPKHWHLFEVVGFKR